MYALVNLASAIVGENQRTIVLEIVEHPSSEEKQVGSIQLSVMWFTPIKEYIEHGVIPICKIQAQTLYQKAQDIQL